jgi:hypothetical protein
MPVARRVRAAVHANQSRCETANPRIARIMTIPILDRYLEVVDGANAPAKIPCRVALERDQAIANLEDALFERAEVFVGRRWAGRTSVHRPIGNDQNKAERHNHNPSEHTIDIVPGRSSLQPLASLLLLSLRERVSSLAVEREKPLGLDNVEAGSIRGFEQPDNVIG